MQGTILTIGELLVEIMATTPGEGFREPIELLGPFPSGAPAIFIDQVAHLGHPAAMVGCVGNDDFGRMTVERLRADGVDVSAIHIDPDAVTGSAFVRYRPDGERDFIFNIRHSAAAKVGLTAAARDAIAVASHLHIVGSSLISREMIETIQAAAEAIKNAGGTVSFDPNVRREIFEVGDQREALTRILALTDLFLPSGAELSLLANEPDADRAIHRLLDHGLAAVVHKQGSRGARYVDPTMDLFVPAFSSTEIDPTGAGDIFGATFVVGWLTGLPRGDNLQHANAAGAIAVTRRGPMEGVSTRREIDALISQQRGNSTVG